MSSVLKVKTARMGKCFGENRGVDEDVTSFFDPLNINHRNMIETGALKLVKVVTKRKTRATK